MQKARIRKDGLASVCFYTRSQGLTKTAINLPGIPSTTGPTPVVPTIVSLGYKVLQPQYIGSFDSDGQFTPENTIETIFALEKQIEQGVVYDLRSEENVEVEPATDLLVAHSFGTYSGIGAIIRGFSPPKAILFSPMFEFGSKGSTAGLKLDLEKHTRHITKALPLTFRMTSPSVLRNFFIEQHTFHPSPDSIPARTHKTRILAVVGNSDPSLIAEVSKQYATTFINSYSHIMELVDFIVVPNGAHGVDSLLTDQVVSAMRRLVNSQY